MLASWFPKTKAALIDFFSAGGDITRAQLGIAGRRSQWSLTPYTAQN